MPGSSPRSRMAASPTGSNHEPPPRPAALRRPLRADHRRSGAPRRHRARRRGGARPHDVRRRVQVRRRQGAARRHGPEPGAADHEALDCVITNALIIDCTGIYKADIGIKGGRIAGIGKAGNPDVMAGRDAGDDRRRDHRGHRRRRPDPHRRRDRQPRPLHLPAAGRRGARQRHHHLLGGGTGPATGTNATTCTPGACYIARMLQAIDDLPLNFGFTGKGNTRARRGWSIRSRAGAIGLKLHEDWGTTPPRRSTAASTSPKARTSRSRSTPTPSTSRASSTTRSPRSRAGPSTPTTRRAPAAATRRTSSGSAASRTCSRAPPTRPGRTRSTRSTSTSTC